MARLRVPVELELRHRGRAIRVRGIVDTGSYDILAISEEAIAPLGLELTNPHKTSGFIEGVYTTAWNAVIDKMQIVGNPDCSIENAVISVARGMSKGGGLEQEEFLLGDEFFRILNAVVEYGEGGVSIKCRPAKVSLNPILVGGGILAASIVVAAITWDL